MQTFLIMLTNWWTTAIGVLGGVALYLIGVGWDRLPTTNDEWFKFALAVIIGLSGLAAKSATTGSTPGGR